MENRQIAEIFNEIADILEIQGENVFRIRSYRRAAQVIENFPYSMPDIAEKGGIDELEKVPGVGQDLARKIMELIETGKCAMHRDLLKTFKPELLQMLKVRGLGPKKVQLFMLTLGIDSIEKLKKAAMAGKLRKLPGMGEKSEAEIIKGLKEMEGTKERMLLNEALLTAEKLIDYLKKCPGVDRANYAGSLRRMKETIGDLDILVTTKKKRGAVTSRTAFDRGKSADLKSAAKIMDHFLKYEDVSSVIAHGDTKSSVLLKSGVQVDLRVIDGAVFGAALHYFTGSKNHNIQIRTRAQKMGLKVSEYGVFKGEKVVAGRTEEELFKKLGLPYIEPEMREDRGEIEAAESGKLPKLIEEKDLKGDFHVHSTWSDGRSTIEEMARAYKEAGYSYIAISDHSPALGGAVKAEDLPDKLNEIAEVNRKIRDFKVLRGTECDIMADGSLDYPDEILAQFDIVIAAVHNRFSLTEKEQTARIIKAMSNPHVNILAHPHGRMLGKREGYEIDMEEIIAAAKEYRVALEINAQPLRLDIYDYNCRLAKEKGVRMVIGSDAHHFSQVEFLSYGVAVARRGWLSKRDVLNTMDLEKVLEWFNKKTSKELRHKKLNTEISEAREQVKGGQTVRQKEVMKEYGLL